VVGVCTEALKLTVVVVAVVLMTRASILVLVVETVVIGPSAIQQTMGKISVTSLLAVLKLQDI
jgi:hypothetical protein